MLVTIEGSINPCSALPRGQRRTVERTAYVDTLIRGGYAVLIAEHREPEPVLSETQRHAVEANAAVEVDADRATEQRAVWERELSKAEDSGKVTAASVNALEAEGLPVLTMLTGVLGGLSKTATRAAIKRGEVTDGHLIETGPMMVDAQGVQLILPADAEG